VVEIKKIDMGSRRDVRRFIGVPFSLYPPDSPWLPPLRSDVRWSLDRTRHPFYAHSDADCFIAESGGRAVGRITVMENTTFNRYRNTSDAFFYYFDAIDDQPVADALFGAARKWASQRGLARLVGPKGFLPSDAMGVLVEGFGHPPAVGLPFDYPYYADLITGSGFEKETDFLSARIAKPQRLPQQVFEMADAVAEQLNMHWRTFDSRREVKRWNRRLFAAYNETFTENWEYWPLEPDEMDAIFTRFASIIDPETIAVILTDDDEIVGHLFGVPDVSRAIIKSRGRLFPFGWARVLRELRRTTQTSSFGMGIRPRYQGTGANLIMYAAFARVAEQVRYTTSELVQVEEGNTRMLSNLDGIGVDWHKRHRVFSRPV